MNDRDSVNGDRKKPRCHKYDERDLLKSTHAGETVWKGRRAFLAGRKCRLESKSPEGGQGRPSPLSKSPVTFQIELLIQNRRDFATDREIGEVIVDSCVGPILFVDLENARVLLVAGWENFRPFTGQHQYGVGATAIDHAADDEHEIHRARRGSFRQRETVAQRMDGTGGVELAGAKVERFH